MSNPPPIPDVPANLLDAVSALGRAADVFRQIISLAVTEDRPIKEIFAEHYDLLAISDQVCEAWVEKLGLREEGDD